MKISEIVALSNREIRSMIRNDPSGARRMIQQLADAGNKRIARMLGDAKGRYSPMAQKAMDKEGPFFSVKGVKDKDTLYNKFQETKRFLDPSKPSHTLKGWKGIVARTEEKLGFQTSKKFWDLYRSYEKSHKGQFPAGMDSTTVQRALGKIRKGRSKLGKKELYKLVDQELVKQYEDEQRAESSSVSNLVDLDDEGNEEEY